MIDHLSLVVRDFARARAFYAAALAPLGYVVLREFSVASVGRDIVGFGVPPKPDFWIAAGDDPTSPLHIAFRAESRSDVDAFHAAALSAGGGDNGPPGLRPHYHPDYYGAFVIDPAGHNIEAVHHGD
ncbi:VOC family protein [Methylosinus sp. Ce-a6]|uniref:VOC family protein n=1 Tax=Methylosinus sp. Ce-a6 TaxID=2172005 RepID=UPI001356D49C|nr:VOC family protein [Methylosinus sp. Ce-a6]